MTSTAQEAGQATREYRVVVTTWERSDIWIVASNRQQAEEKASQLHWDHPELFDSYDSDVQGFQVIREREVQS